MVNIEEILNLVEKQVENIDDELVAHYVWKKYKDPFKLLISIVLSIRSKEENTFKACENLFSKVKSPEDLLNLSEAEIENLIKPCGLSKQKAKWIKDLAKYYIENGNFPENLNDLTKLPGVGRKVANVYLAIALNKDVIAVDTHVHRVFNRIGIISTKTPEEMEQELYRIVPKHWWKKINEIIVKFGRNVCLPKKPKCEVCLIKKYCKYYLKFSYKK